MQDTKAVLNPEGIYHIYNRANGSERLFFEEENYKYFLRKYSEYISPVADTFCWCLMPNHFHFLIRIKSEKEISKLKLCQGFETLTELEQANFLSRRFSHLLNGYTQAINKQQNRKGSLFMRPFKRKQITDEIYLRKVVLYIHQNPVQANLSSKLDGWKYSSYLNLAGLTSHADLLNLKKAEIIEWFGDKENFIYCHKKPAPEMKIEI